MNPYEKGSHAYKKAAVNTQDQGTLILMMYDGLVRFLKAGLLKMEAKDLEGTHNNLVRAKDIVAELMASLNLEGSGEMGANLKALYAYMYNRLIDANVQKNAQLVEEVLGLVLELREGWRGVIDQRKKAGSTPYAQTKGAIKPLNVEG